MDRNIHLLLKVLITDHSCSSVKCCFVTVVHIIIIITDAEITVLLSQEILQDPVQKVFSYS